MILTSKRFEIRSKLVLSTNRKLNRDFRLVPNSVTLNDLERLNGRYFVSFYPKR